MPRMILATSKYLCMDDVLAFRASSKTLFENQTKEAEIHAATDLIHLFETGNDSEVIAVCECLVKRKKFIRSFRLHRAFRSWQVPLTSKKNMRRFKSSADGETMRWVKKAQEVMDVRRRHRPRKWTRGWIRKQILTWLD